MPRRQRRLNPVTSFFESRSARARPYALAAMSVAAGIGVRLALQPLPNLTIPIAVSLAAVIVTAYAGGRGPALVAAAANLLANSWYFSPRVHPAIEHPADLWRLLIFASAALLVSFFSHRLPGAGHVPRVALLLGATVLMLIVSVLVWFDITNARAAEKSVEHTYQVLEASDLAMSTLQGAENSQRNYLLTGDGRYLDSYGAAVSKQREARDRLRNLTGDNASQQRRITALGRLVDARIQQLELTIALRRDHGITAAVAQVRLGLGAQLMSQLEAVIAAIQTEEHRLLTLRTNAATQQAARTRLVLAVGTALLIVVLILAGITIERDVEKLQSSERTLRRQADLLDRAQGPIIVFQLGGEIEYWNHAAEELYGFSRQEAVGRDHNILLRPMHPLGMPEIQKILAREGTWSGELTHRIGGREILVESHMTVVTEPDGRRTVIKANRDITAEKLAQAEIRKLTEDLEQRVKDRTAQLEASNHELEAFAYSVSHDLRAPLRGIDGWSLALLEDYGHALDETARQYLDRVRSETQRMGFLIDDLLKLSRLTRVEMQQEEVDLSAVARRIADRLREAQSGRNIQFSIEDGLETFGDARLLEVVLENLLSNAVKFTGPRTEARIEFGRTNHGETPAFYVRDNGVGFNMAYSQTLFGAFQRLHKYTEFPGTGIGLATAQRVLRRHGGKIWADARPDDGATFYFTVGADGERRAY